MMDMANRRRPALKSGERLYRRIPVSELDRWMCRGWHAVPKAETYNGSRWAVLIWKEVR